MVRKTFQKFTEIASQETGHRSTTAFMSSRARNFRRRGGDDDSDDDKDEKGNKSISANGPAITASTKPQPKSSATKPRKPATPVPRSRLSFADDEEDADETPIKARPASSSSRLSKPYPSSSSSSSSHHKLTSAKDRKTVAAPRSSIPSNVQPQAGTYTPESLLELQKNTRTFASSRVPRTESKSKTETTTPNEPVIVLKGLVKPSVTADLGEKIEHLGQDFEDDEMGFEEKDSRSKNERGGATVKIGSMSLGKGLREKNEDSAAIIMDQARIDAIKAQRERLRQAGPAAQDYIALDGGSNHGEAEGLSDEEPEFRGRIGFFGAKIDSIKKGVFENYEDRVVEKVTTVVGGDDDEDEEEKLWEEEQARKGLGKRLDESVSLGVSTISVGNGNSSVNAVQKAHQQNFGSSAMVAGVYSSVQSSVIDHIGLSIGGANGTGLGTMSISQQAEVTKKALYDNVRTLEESHSRTMASYSRNDTNLSASLSNVTNLENAFSAAGEKFLFMQKLRDFLSVICDFLQYKAPYIEELEDQIKKLDEKRAAAITERRSADNSDEMRELEAAVNAAMSVLSKGVSSAATVEAATKAAQAASAQSASAAERELKNLPVVEDEFGRDSNLQKRRDLMRRAQDRQRRKAKADLKRLSSMDVDGSSHPIGESSTDESDSENAAYQSSRDELLKLSELVFSDAAKDFARLSAVVERFQIWKKEYASSYQDVYMSLSAPTIFSPYVRLELLKWDPLHEDSDFIDMEWHSLLFDYGAPDDADANLIPELVEKVAIPILYHQLDKCWDMLSTRETKYAVSATTLVFGYVSASSSALGDLITSLHDRLTDAVANLTIPTWDTLLLKAVPNAARVAAHRFGVSVRLMKNICLWNKILAIPILEKLALDQLLNGKVLPHLRSIQSNIHDAITRSERVVASLDGVWAGQGVTGDRSPKLQTLVDYLLTLGKILEKRPASAGIQTETANLARRLKRMLVELNEYDHARAISRTFNLKEAL